MRSKVSRNDGQSLRSLAVGIETKQEEVYTMEQLLTRWVDGALELVYSWEPLVARTVVLVPSAFREQINQLANSAPADFDMDAIRFIAALFMCYPFGMVMNTLPYGRQRHIFSAIAGAFMLQFTIGPQWIHHVLSSAVVYSMLACLPRHTNTFAVPLFTLVYLALGHLHRQYTNYLGYDLDFTCSQMVLTQKLYMMAYNLYDGEILKQGKEAPASTKCAPFALRELPSFLEYLGYTFCFSNLLVGPAYEFSIYKAACDGTNIGKRRPSNVLPTLRPLFTSILCSIIYVVGGNRFPLLDSVDPQKNQPFILQEEFLRKPLLNRFAHIWIGQFCARHRYYFGWKTAEGANNIWYAGFQGFDKYGKPIGWDNASNVDMLQIETAPSVQSVFREWNKKTSLFLKRYVYIRTNGNLMACFSFLAIWHGFYPGYYVYFLSAPLIMYCDRLGREKISPYFSSEKWSLYGCCCIVTVSLAASYFTIPLTFLSHDRSWSIWKSIYFCGHVVVFLFGVVVLMLPTPKNKVA